MIMIKYRVYRGQDIIADFFTIKDAENFIDLDSKSDNDYELFGKDALRDTIKIYIYINSNFHLQSYTIQPIATEERNPNDV